MSTSNSDSENLLLPNLIQDSSIGTGEKIHEPRFHTHHLPSADIAITIRTLPSLGLSFQLWPSSLSLLSHFQSLLGPTCQPPPPPPTNILELGSGSGLLGISLACLFSCHVTLTDLPAVLPNIHFNASANSTAVQSSNGTVTVSPLRWGDSGDIEAVIAGNGGSSNNDKFDLVVASDVVYYEELVEPLIRTLQVFVKGETEFVMGHLRRWKRTDSRFFKMARKVFDVDVVGKDAMPVEGWRHPVVVYRFTARKGKKKL